MKTLNNRRVCDLNKAQWVEFYYRNQHGQVSPTALSHSVFGQPYKPEDSAMTFSTAVPVKSLEQLAVEKGIKDIWTPEIKVIFASNHAIRYTGDKAVSINREWNRRIFKKGKNK